MRCRFAYVVNSVPFQSRVILPGKHHSLQNPEQLPPDAIQMQAWANHHKKGSQLTIHYDPSNPAEISLAGEGDEIRTNSAAIALVSAKQAAIVGGLLLGLAALARRLTSVVSQ